MGLPVTPNSSGGVHVLNSASHVMREEQRNSRWNLQELGEKLAIDAISAASAAGLVAPTVTVVDKYACYWEPFVTIQIVARESLSLIHAPGQSLKESQAAYPSLGRYAAPFEVSFSAHTVSF